MTKFNKDKDWLIEEYINKNRKREDIALECGLTVAGLKSLLSKLGIQKPKLIITKNDLEELIDRGLTASEIAKNLSAEETAVYRRLKDFDLSIPESSRKQYIQYDDTNDSLICELYSEGFSSVEIAKLLETSHITILHHLKHCGIETRTLSESQWVYNGKDFPEDLKNFDIVYDLYISQKLSKKDISKLYGCSAKVVDRVLRNFNIDVRGNSEARIGLYSGKDHWNWQGGITPLHYRVREFFYTNQVPNILKRDNYCCRLCGGKHELQVHHIVSFSSIFHEILKENSNLDIILDVDKLYDIMIHDDRFIDETNLITYCKECHLFKIHGYNHK